jgi:glycosyltransferase involved in cell wall biosynthesis
LQRYLSETHEEVKILNIFNHYLEEGGEAKAVESICDSVAKICDLKKCEFRSSDWIGPGSPSKWKQAFWAIRNPESLQKLHECNNEFRADAWLLHNILPVGSLAIYSEARRAGIPVIQYIHNFRPFSVNGYLWARGRPAVGGLSKNYWEEVRYASWRASHLKTAWLALVLLFGHATHKWDSVNAWIAISDFLREKFIAAGIPREKIFTLRHSWRPRPESTAAYGSHYLYLGRLTEAKGIQVLLDAWKILEQDRRAPPLLIAGDGPLRSIVASCAEGMRSITYAGTLSGTAKHEALLSARAIVIPSISWEGLGLVGYEGYDYSRPVLSARSGGLSEVVRNGETGLLHEPGNAKELADHVLSLERDRDLSLSMGEAGRTWLIENANEERWQKKFLEIASYAIG